MHIPYSLPATSGANELQEEECMDNVIDETTLPEGAPTPEGSADAAPEVAPKKRKASTAASDKPKRESKKAKAAREAAEAAALAAKSKGGAGKFKGRGTCAHLGIPAGLRRMEFQDRLLAVNGRKDMRKTDLELAKMMDTEHPGGCAIRPDHMRAIRRLYNAGRHTKLATIPEVASVEYAADKSVVAEKKSKVA